MLREARDSAMRLLLCPLDLEAQFSRINREYLPVGDAPLSSGPNSAEGVTLVLSVEKGKKKKCSIPPGKDAGTVD